MPGPGLLSQTIANLQNLENQLSVIGSLPAAAAGIQATAVNVYLQDIANLKLIQSDVQAYTSANIPQLNTALKSLNAGQVTGVAAILSVANLGATALSGTVAGILNSIGATKAQVISLSNGLSGIQSQLNAQVISLNLQVQDAQSKAAQYNKEKYYFLALGPFGLVGLGIAIGLLETWNSKANALESQASAMQAQVASLNVLIANVGSVISNFNTCVNQVSYIANSINVLSGDIGAVINDLNNSGGAVATLFLTAAIHEMETLSTDAS